MRELYPQPGAVAPFEILLVEDNAADVRLMREIFSECHIQNNLRVVHDGEQALHYLHREDQYGNAPRPDLVLLDLNLPKCDGRAVLRDIKNHASLRRIPVIVLTTSMAEEDVTHAYDLHANGYILKPLDLDEFVRVMRQIEEFWLNAVRLPH